VTFVRFGQCCIFVNSPFSLFKVPPKIAVFGELVVPHGSVDDFTARVLLQSLSDVIHVTSDDHRSIGLVYTSVLAGRSRKMTIMEKLGFWGLKNVINGKKTAIINSKKRQSFSNSVVIVIDRYSKTAKITSGSIGLVS
jgi:hypothetical protein